MELKDCHSRFDLYRLLETSGATGPAVEIGVADGSNAVSILELWPSLQQLYLVDLWQQQPWDIYTDGCNRTDEEMLELLSTCYKLVEKFTGRWTICQQESLQAAAEFSTRSLLFALAYVDANHSYVAVQRDLPAWYQLIRPGGILAGHDYDESHPGTRQAVDEFARREQLALYVLNDSRDCSWAVRKP